MHRHTIAKLISDFDLMRKRRLAVLRAMEPSLLSSEDVTFLKLAPIDDDVLFLLPRGEPFFEVVYGRLVSEGRQIGGGLHFGIGNTRNFSIIAAARSHGAILMYYNLSEQKVIDGLLETAGELCSKYTIGNFGPADLVEQFASHPVSSLLTPTLRSKGIHIDLAEDLIVPESWLFRRQKDGRFNHVMRLIKQGCIGSVAMNIVDQAGFMELRTLLASMGQRAVAPATASIRTVFLANVLYHLGLPHSYIEFGKKDLTPRRSIDVAFRNIDLLAPNNPYVVLAHFFVQDLHENRNLHKSVAARLDTPTHNDLAKADYSDPRSVVRFSDAPHYCDWEPFHYATMGGRLEDLKLILPRVSRQNPIFGCTEDKNKLVQLCSAT